MESRFTPVEDEKLIEMVRGYPLLYNLSDRKYKDSTIKENIWKEISNAIGKNGKLYKYQCDNVNNNIFSSVTKLF